MLIRGFHCFLALALASLLLPASSEACFPGTCPEADFVPRSGATIPSNAPALVYRTYQLDSQPNLRLVRLNESAEEDVPFSVEAVGDSLLRLSPVLRAGDSFVIRPTQLVAGARYRLFRPGARCPESTEFQVAEAAALPQAIGALSVGPEKQDCVRMPGGSACFSAVPAPIVELSLRFHESALPWIELLQIRNLVDDQLWAPGWELRGLPPLQGRTRELLYISCRRNPSWPNEAQLFFPEAGEHRVRVEARLPGASLLLRTPEQHTTLTCDYAWLDSFQSNGPDACLRPPLDLREVTGEPVQEVPQEPEASPDAGPQVRPHEPSACAVSAPGTKRSSPLPLLWLAALAWRRARRQRARDRRGPAQRARAAASPLMAAARLHVRAAMIVVSARARQAAGTAACRSREACARR